MLLTYLIILPFIGIIVITGLISYDLSSALKEREKLIKGIALATSVLDLSVSLIIWLLFDNNNKNFQFAKEQYEISYYNFHLGIDGLSIYFILLTTIIIPIAIISNWKSLKDNVLYFPIILLLIEGLLLVIFSAIDLLMYYIFFESILAPLFILIGIFGSKGKLRASFYFFLYTFIGSLFMLLSIITMQSLIGTADLTILSKHKFLYISQIFMFIGIFIAFAVKTPVIYLNGWLLRAHVESPLSGSIILAAIVLKLSLYGILRLILPILPEGNIHFTYAIFTIVVLTIIYASLSTLRTIDVKEIIAYSSVSHAAVYLGGMLCNVIYGIQGAIALGLAHGFVSSGLFSVAGGVLYDRSSTRLATYYKGLTQVMPLCSILFFILCLGNCGAPLTLNFFGEFLSLYGIFERLPLAGILAASSIIFSAAFTILLYNRIFFGGSLNSINWNEFFSDLSKREHTILIILVIFTISLGIYPSILTDSLLYVSDNMLFNIN